MSVYFRYEGNFKKAEASLKKAFSDSLTETADTMRDKISAAAPVDTGELRRSIESRRKSETEAVVGAKAKHAPFIEFGTSKMKAQPFFKNKGIEGANEFQHILKRNINKNMGGV